MGTKLPPYEITWSLQKAQANLGKHGIDFALAATVLLDPLALTVFDAAHSEAEERWFTLGLACDGQCLAVAHTWRAEHDTIHVRMISARPATRREREQYAHLQP